MSKATEVNYDNTLALINMEPDKQRAAIAIYCGWKFDSNAYKQWISPNGTSWNYPPAYDKDLNFMFVAEHYLPMDLQDTYMKHLHDITGIEGWGICHALAEVRVEAFLKTIGKWREIASLRDHAERVGEANDRLVVENAALRADKDRLDWLARNRSVSSSERPLGVTPESLRAAIDAARKEAQQ